MMLPGTDVPIPAGTTDLGMGSVQAVFDTIQRSGGYLGPFALGLLIDYVASPAGGGQFPPHWRVWVGGRIANGYMLLGTQPIAGLTDYAAGQWVLTQTTGEVLTVLGRTSTAWTFGGAA